jgi:cytochrome c peroxidase
MNARILVLTLFILNVGCNAVSTVSLEQQHAPLPELVEQPVDRVELGRLLFWDPILSGDRDVACASCHHPDFGYADGSQLSVGVGGTGIGPARSLSDASARRTTRNAMTILNTAYNGFTLLQGNPRSTVAPMFWDNRSQGMEAQAIEPLKSEIEMRGVHYGRDVMIAELLSRLRHNTTYVAAFESVFGPGDITETHLASALSTFERSLVTRQSSFDRFLRGDDRALTAQQQRGYQQFVRSGCAGCHSGPMFSDFQMHHLGIKDLVDQPHDVGDGQDQFRTASLRMVSRTGPYMHNGRFGSLDDVFEFYDEQVDRNTDPLLADVEPPFGSARDDVRAFFESISDGEYDRLIPYSVPSGLRPGGGQP